MTQVLIRTAIYGEGLLFFSQSENALHLTAGSGLLGRDGE